MELLAVVNKLIEYFKLEDIGELIDKLKVIVLSDDKNKIYDDYLKIVGDLEIDWIQKIFQYYKSNREDLKQDYTPKSLSKCLAELCCFDDARTVLDVCSGSGSLIIEMSKKNKNLKFDCLELDDNVIPLLLFNLSIHNIEARVFKYDVIKQEMYECYVLTKSDKYSDIKQEKVCNQFISKYDIVTSNPPFNLKTKLNYISNTGLAIKNSSNAYFTLFCVEHLKKNGRSAIILPTGFITAQKKEDLAVREYLINHNMLDAVLSCPGNFFESTATNTSILLIDNECISDKTILVDSSNSCSEWIREQRGQFGGAAHTGRVYKKKFNYYSDDDIRKIVDAIKDKKEIKDFSIIPTKKDFKEKKYSCSAGQYFEVEIQYIDITQEEYDDMIDTFVSGFEEFTSGLLNLQSHINEQFIKENKTEVIIDTLKKENEKLIQLKQQIMPLLINGQLEL